MILNTEPNLADPDRIYQQLIVAHAGRSEEESARINARLILILANQVGDDAVVCAAIASASRDYSA